MFKDVAQFLFLWILILCMMASVTSLLFGDIEDYAGFFRSFFNMFGTGLGNYEFEEFDESNFNPNIGKFFIVMAVIVNSIVLLNFIIAILAETYSRLSEKSRGLYYDGIIARIPTYEDDSRFGGLIVATPPFNFLAILLLPIFWCFRNDERALRSINDKFTKVIYLPIALFSVLFFATFTLIMVPFAYIVSITDKIRILMLVSRQNRKKEKVS